MERADISSGGQGERVTHASCNERGEGEKSRFGVTEWGGSGAEIDKMTIRLLLPRQNNPPNDLYRGDSIFERSATGHGVAYANSFLNPRLLFGTLFLWLRLIEDRQAAIRELFNFLL